MDNASYHTNPASGSINVSSWTKEEDATTFLDQYGIPYREGRAPRGDTLIQLQTIASDWLNAKPQGSAKTNAEIYNIIVDLTRVQQILKERGHFPPLMTPPYHPEFQPIKDLRRDVKQYVARHYSRQRSFADMTQGIVAAFRLYGTPASCHGYWKTVDMWEKKYIEFRVYAEPVDLTVPRYHDLTGDETDDEGVVAGDDEFYASDTDDDED